MIENNQKIGLEVGEGGSALIIGGLTVQNNQIGGLLADGAGTLTLGSVPSNPSSIQNNGGTDVDLRLSHAEQLAALPLDGLALGGFSVGESGEAMHSTLSAVASLGNDSSACITRPSSSMDDSRTRLHRKRAARSGKHSACTARVRFASRSSRFR
jgi:hypothetical protein